MSDWGGAGLSEGHPTTVGAWISLQGGVKTNKRRLALEMISALKVLKNTAKQVLIRIPPSHAEDNAAYAQPYLSADLEEL